MRNPFRRRDRRDAKSWSANVQHPFQEARDGFLAAYATGGGGPRGTTPITAVATTSAFERTTGCAVPQCGRAPADPIHAPPDA
ncbi:MAG TPA: hypothetical protein VFY23_07960 [Candidatus Limnocylindrales bacterium]|nr:hypothetical protein [Candidatus Limnocylindrales bacterium]